MKEKILILILSISLIMSLFLTVHYRNQVNQLNDSKNTSVSFAMVNHYHKLFTPVQHANSSYESLYNYIQEPKQLTHLIKEINASKEYYIMASKIEGKDHLYHYPVSNLFNNYVAYLEYALEHFIEHNAFPSKQEHKLYELAIEDVLYDIEVIGDWYAKRHLDNEQSFYTIDLFYDEVFYLLKSEPIKKTALSYK
ncbi:hypothetical protein EDC19_2392 [Natranaerovirga hydrolytica]|uniref:Uncharacterized protein n=1 Tax=Natranaerovirga hydrolytica TaxID=680378 RepID=A0A4R1MLB9_9FIRM|nr:hypothetical protein [Natranaerovirga hydrolytica]TCK90623.1 hypothetical protein EDC19_2392 [Natranaerovirga hydrolytica]